MIVKLIVLACAALLAGSAAAAGNGEVLVPVQKFIDGMSKGDYKLAAGGFVDDASIIDDMAPYLWQGKGSTAIWLAAIESSIKTAGTRDFVMKLGKPLQVQMNGDIAYAVVPSSFSYKLNGKAGKGANTITVVEHKDADGWRITGFAVSAH